MQPIYIVLIAVVVLAIVLGVIYSASSRLIDLFEKNKDIRSKIGINTISLLYFLRDTFELDFDIRRIRGKLNDCYIPSKKFIALSDDTYYKDSVAALTIISHEVGHAIQHKKNPFAFNFHRFLGMVTAFFGKFALPAIIASVIMTLLAFHVDIAMIMLYISIGVLALGLLFKFLTIPIEYSASKIALNFLKDYHILDETELKLAKKLTDAAAFTYVAEFVKDILGLNLLKRS